MLPRGKSCVDVSDEALSRSEATGEPISADTSADKQPTVVSGFRHLIKINLLIHDVVQNLYTSRKAGIKIGRAHV